MNYRLEKNERIFGIYIWNRSVQSSPNFRTRIFRVKQKRPFFPREAMKGYMENRAGAHPWLYINAK